MKAMVLGAGLGTRMAPLAGRIAKPALPILGEPLALRMVRMLASQGVSQVVVNTHAHPDSLRLALAEAPIPVVFSHEPTLRGTGGGVLGARRWLEGPDPFLVLNGDMVVDVDLAALLRSHRAGGTLATLLLRDDPRKRAFGELGYDAAGGLCRITDRVSTGPESGSGLFTGVHLLEPALFERMPDRTTFDSMVDVYVPLLRQGIRLSTSLQSRSACWWPAGTPSELLDANLEALKGLPEVQYGNGQDPRNSIYLGLKSRVEGEIEGPAWIGNAAVVEAGGRAGPWIVLSPGSRVASGARIERSLALPGAVVEANGPLREVIIGCEGMWMRD